MNFKDFKDMFECNAEYSRFREALAALEESGGWSDHFKWYTEGSGEQCRVVRVEWEYTKNYNSNRVGVGFDVLTDVYYLIPIFPIYGVHEWSSITNNASELATAAATQWDFEDYYDQWKLEQADKRTEYEEDSMEADDGQPEEN